MYRAVPQLSHQNANYYTGLIFAMIPSIFSAKLLKNIATWSCQTGPDALSKETLSRFG